jgi:membrane-associated HD superfamily phosphohydrolase
MVKAVFRVASLAAVALLPIFNLSAKALGDYQIGDKLEEDIVATSKISVVDPDGTQALKEKEALRVPVVVRYYTNAADELEARFRQEFASTRENFLQAVEKSFGHRTLTAEELSSFKFDSLATLFQKQNNLFPLSTNRAALWATGDADEGYEASLASTLRQMMAAPIRPEPLPDNFKLSANNRLVPVGKSSDIVSDEEARDTKRNFARTNFVTLATVKKNLQGLFNLDEREVGKHLATLIKPNCVVDEELTQKLRDKRTEGMWSVVDFDTGQTIAHRGQVIDKKIKAAIDQIKEKAVVGQLQELQAKQQAAVGELQQLVAADKAKGTRSQEHVMWLVGALAAGVLILAIATWQLARRRHPVSMLPATVGGNAGDWQQRALVAEQRTEKLQSAARAGLIAYLSQWFSRMLTQRLISQRRLLLETHDNAAAEMTALEARLEKVQAPLQVRLAAYEHRIVELEKELAARGEENRELLKAKIEMMRKQLEAERAKNRVEFN